MGTGRRMERYEKIYTTDMYIDGNTVRRVETVPDEHRQRRERIDREREEKRRSSKRVARRNQEKALRMSRGYVMFLSMAVVLTCLFCAAYIRLQSDLTGRMNRISKLESQVTDITTDNAATRKRIETSVDLNHIKDVAVNQLGMVYASPDQIMYYEVASDDYMNQYGDIPSK